MCQSLFVGRPLARGELAQTILEGNLHSYSREIASAEVHGLTFFFA